MLQLLLWVALVSVAAVVLYLQVSRRADIREKIPLMEEQIAKISERTVDEAVLLRKREELLGLLDREKSKFYTVSQIDPYRFGIIIRDLLVANDLTITRYQTVEAGERTFLEFSVSGAALSFIGFIEAVSTSEVYWTVPFLSINARDEAGQIQSVFRIGYETREDLDR